MAAIPPPVVSAGLLAEEVRHQVAAFAAAEIAPLAAAIDREDRFPRELWPRLGALGLLGLTVEPEWGGAGMGYAEHVVAMEEISRASAAVGLSYAAHSNLCVNQIRRLGTDSQKRRWLPRLLSGEWVGGLAMTEAGAGSDVMSMRLRAERHGDAFVLTGTKLWITNGPDADLLVVYAKTDPTAGSRGLTAFLVETAAAGFRVAQKLDKLGMRGSSTGELVFDGVEVPAENVLGRVDAGAAVLMSGLDFERVVLSGGPLGLMAACHDLVLPYVHQRHQFGRPVGTFELMQGKLADLYVAWSAARAYAYAVAAACDAGRCRRRDAAGVLLFCAERATECALQAIQALGGMGYVNDMPAGRLLRDAKLYEIGAGTSEIRRMLIGRELFEETEG